MSVNITTSFVEQYSANVSLLAQQTGSKLRSAVDVESVRGKNAFLPLTLSTSTAERNFEEVC